MNKTVSSIIKLLISVGLGVLIIFLVAKNFEKPLKIKLDSKHFSKENSWELESWYTIPEYTMVGDTLAILKNENGLQKHMISIYEGEIVSKDIKPKSVVKPGDVMAKIKVDIWSITRDAFKRTNYFWIILSMLFALLSHISRSIRWQMLFEPMGYKPKLGNATGAVLVMYLANLAFPRLGEVLRCSVLARFEKIPIEKSLGTMITERAVDVISLLVIIVLCLILQNQIFVDFYKTYMGGDDGSGAIKYILLGIAILGCLVTFLLFKTGKLPFANKIESLVKGVWDGIKSIKDLKKPGLFIFHTIAIWVLYYLMIAVCFKALPETSNITLIAGLPTLAFGAFAMVAVQGGLGLYPYIVSKLMVMYGLAETIGYAFGWVIWSAQTLLVIIAGVAAYIFLNIYNSKRL